ncbi:MAG TPA: DUF3891 family protein [Opitutaceae bacterium]
MIRSETGTGWLLVTHPDHAHLAGEFADAWGNGQFARPEPFAPARYAVYHHDDGWLARDAAPSLTKEGRPEAFTRALVGAYSAFEEIDLPSYLRVRGEATAAVAAHDGYAGILVSMHTVNLLTEQADVATIRPEHRAAHAEFVAQQQAWQRETATRLGVTAEELQRGFEFLQCCDNLSLIVCSGYDAARNLRHTHPDRSGKRHTLQCASVETGVWRISPWPFQEARLEFAVPFRHVPASACKDVESLRTAFRAAPMQTRKITLTAL